MPSLDEGLEKFDIKNDISGRDALHESNRNDPVDEAIKPGALAPETTPQPNICYPLSATTVDIYMYHYVRESRRDTPGSVIYNNSITPETARAHYAHLSQMQQADTAHIALMSEIEQYQTENCFPHKRMIVLMFDDGRRDNYRYLLPLAREFNIKANL